MKSLFNNKNGDFMNHFKNNYIHMNANLTTFEIILLYALVLMCAVLVFIAFSIWQTVKAIKKSKGLSETELIMENRTFWQKVFSLKPLTMEKDLELEHKYDEIAELDNPTPPWFMYLFYATIVFALVYLIVFHVSGDGKIMETEYALAMKEANIEHEEYMKKFANSVNENNVVALTDAKSVGDGKAIYLQNCLACHGAEGQGGVGPNLTDAYWLHGGSVKEIFHTITEGVPEKGMISWKKSLNPIQIQHVVSFMETFKGTKPANAKEPQGSLIDSTAVTK
jgi:cytochrome c oxidase cbb3-type subunit III